jgi:hypothetical protein
MAPRQVVILSKRFCAAKDLGEPREASRLLRRITVRSAHILIDDPLIRRMD